MFRQSIVLLDFVLTILSAVSHLQNNNQTQQPPLKEVAKYEAQRPTGVALSDSGGFFVNFPLREDQHRQSIVEGMSDGVFSPFFDQQLNSWTCGSHLRDFELKARDTRSRTTSTK